MSIYNLKKKHHHQTGRRSLLVGPSALSSRKEEVVRRAGVGGVALAGSLAYLFLTSVIFDIVLTGAPSVRRELVQVKRLPVVVMMVRTWGNIFFKLFEYLSCWRLMGTMNGPRGISQRSICTTLFPCEICGQSDRSVLSSQAGMFQIFYQKAVFCWYSKFWEEDRVIHVIKVTILRKVIVDYHPLTYFHSKFWISKRQFFRIYCVFRLHNNFIIILRKTQGIKRFLG